MPDPFKDTHQKSLTEEDAAILADSTHSSPFHTIGKGSTQAAAGNHKHDELYLSPDDIIAGTGIKVMYSATTGKLTIALA